MSRHGRHGHGRRHGPMDLIWGILWFIVVVTLLVLALQNGAAVGGFLHDMILGAIDLIRSAVTGG